MDTWQMGQRSHSGDGHGTHHGCETQAAACSAESADDSHWPPGGDDDGQ